MSEITGGVTLLFLCFAYILPTLIAHSRSHHNTGAIFALNLLLGWSGLGWVAAFVWALTEVHQHPATPSLKAGN